MKKEQTQMVTLRHAPRQRLIGIVALAVLFGCGIMVGMTINGRNDKGDMLHDKQCESLASEIMGTLHAWDKIDLVRLKELNEIYAANCDGYIPQFDRQLKDAESVVEPKQKTCAVIENMLVPGISDEDSLDADKHYNNIDIYKKLIENGCSENVEKYQALIVREQEILAALTGQASSEDTQTCAEIERLLTQNTYTCSTDAECHINNAKVYANISERGCSENQQKYVNLAAKELEIARALQDDNFDDYEREQISDTYKRIQMKQTANEIMNKVQKLADPAIDFIIQAQKIIEE